MASRLLNQRRMQFEFWPGHQISAGHKSIKGWADATLQSLHGSIELAEAFAELFGTCFSRINHPSALVVILKELESPAPQNPQQLRPRLNQSASSEPSDRPDQRLGVTGIRGNRRVQIRGRLSL